METGTFALASPPVSSHTDDMPFPEVTGRSLDGVEIGLPRGLPAVRTLAVIAFQQRHQACVDRWIARAEADGVPGSPLDVTFEPTTCVVEIPVLSSRWKLGRSFIDGGMAANIRIPRVLARTITVYTDVGAFQRAIGIPDSAEVNACVVTRTGEILARVAGEPTDAAWQTISRQLKAS